VSGLTRFLMDEVEVPLITVTADLEEAGYLVNRAHFHDLRRRLEAERREVESTIRAVPEVGADFNPASTAQVGRLLYETLGLPVTRKTESGRPSTDEQALTALRGKHRVVELLLRHRELTKPIGTYCTIPDDADPDGRLRVEFNQLGAESGRYTSPSKLQTIPKDDRLGIRKGFIAGAGMRIVAADFNQQELRVLAQVSGDENLRDAIRGDIDLHGLAAVKVFGLDCEPNEVKANHKDARDRVKAIQFGIIYGRGPNSLAAELGISLEEAQELLDGYFKKFSAVKAFIEEVTARVVRDGYVDDLFGRRRQFPDARLDRPRKQYDRMTRAEQKVFGKINAAKRSAQNFAIQAPSATITKLAMLNCHRHLKAEHPEVKMILTLHDELQFEVPEGEVAHLAGELPRLMCELGLERFGFEVPMAVEVKEGPSWGELKPYEARKG